LGCLGISVAANVLQVPWLKVGVFGV
jgi:hypothetical protein